MAIHEGIFTLSGKMGNTIFYTRNGKHFARSAAMGDYKQPEVCRKSGTDFGRANTAAALIRRGFKPLIDQLADSRFDDRLKRTMIKIVNTGPVALKGSRQVTDGDVALLKRLEFNQYTSVDKLITVSPSIAINPGKDITISLPKRHIASMFYPPVKATKAILQFRCCLFYFDVKNGHFTMPDDLPISLEQTSFPGGKFCLPLPDAGDCVLTVAWGIHFMTADSHNPIGNRKHYAARIIEAVNIVDDNIVSFQYPEPVTVTLPAVTTGHRVTWEMNKEE